MNIVDQLTNAQYMLQCPEDQREENGSEHLFICTDAHRLAVPYKVASHACEHASDSHFSDLRKPQGVEPDGIMIALDVCSADLGLASRAKCSHGWWTVVSHSQPTNASS